MVLRFGFCVLVYFLVPMVGVEPTRNKFHSALNAACLPVSPHRLDNLKIWFRVILGGKNKMKSRDGLPIEFSCLEDGEYPVAINPVFKEIQVPWRGGCMFSYLPLSENNGKDWQGVSAILVHLGNPYGYTNDAPLYCRISRNDLTGIISLAEIKQYKKLIIRKGKIIDIV